LIQSSPAERQLRPATGVPAPPAAAAPVAYAPVYYPGTSVVNDAGVITLRPGEERSGVDFSLQFVPTAQITGRVVDADGRPMNGISVMLRPARTDGMDLFTRSSMHRRGPALTEHSPFAV
jgi:hypothetical protein